MTKKAVVAQVGLTKEQLELIERFQTDYNAVDQFLRKHLNADKLATFTSLVNQYERKHPGWRDADVLKMIAEVRNLIVHCRTEPYGYGALPTSALAGKLSGCLDGLIRPVCVIPKYQRKVTSVSIDDTLSHVLTIINKQQYSQFPVHAAKRFYGLLTENGITRWLAHHVTAKLSLVDLDDVTVKHVLQNEEKRSNFRFVPRTKHVEDVNGLFASDELLEAVLITAHGKESEALLGIATRWDIAHRS